MSIQYKVTCELSRQVQSSAEDLRIPMVALIRTVRGNGLKEAKDEMDRLGPQLIGRELTLTMYLGEAALGRLYAWSFILQADRTSSYRVYITNVERTTTNGIVLFQE